jgi:inward rectifier potassium channel
MHVYGLLFTIQYIISMIEKEYKKDETEIGFGSKGNASNHRLINKDGSFNIRNERSNIQRFGIYHALITMSWLKFTLIILVYFIIVNALFGLFYFLLGKGALNGIDDSNSINHFLSCVYFSTQTISTVGYGGINPSSAGANIISSLEALLGLLGFALITGLLYGRFSRPKANIRFTDYAILTNFKVYKALQFRMVNELINSQISDLECVITVSMVEDVEGQSIRKYHRLELEISSIFFFPMVWTINHIIDEKSPLYNISLKEFQDRKGELLILVRGFDDTFSSTVNKRTSYTYQEIIEGVKFKSVFTHHDNGSVYQNLNLFNELEAVD